MLWEAEQLCSGTPGWGGEAPQLQSPERAADLAPYGPLEAFIPRATGSDASPSASPRLLGLC